MFSATISTLGFLGGYTVSLYNGNTDTAQVLGTGLGLWEAIRLRDRANAAPEEFWVAS